MATIKLKRSAVQGKIPVVGDLALGELGINTYDGKMYIKKDDGVASIVEIGGDKQQALNSSVDIIVKSATVYGDILPDSSITRNIGSDTLHFKEAWIDTLHLAANTLYIGDTPVLGTTAQDINIRGDVDQNIIVQAQGAGISRLLAAAGAEVIATGLNADAKLQATGSGGRVVLGSNTSVNITAPSTIITGDSSVSGTHTVGHLVVSGNLTISGTTTSVNTTNLDVEDNIILLNSGETGSGVGLVQSGLRVDRGQLADELLVWDDSIDKWVMGPLGGTLVNVASESYVLGITDNLVPKNNAELTGIPVAPTASSQTNNTQLATTEFVHLVAAGISAGSGHQIQDEGVAQTSRANLNFVGSGVTVTDDATNDASIVTINASAGSIDLTPEVILAQDVISTDLTTVYTASSKKQIKEIFLCNQSAASILIDVVLLLDGETLGTKNYLFKTQEIKQGETIQLQCNQIMPVGSQLQLKTNQGVVSFLISGNSGLNTECDTFLAQAQVPVSIESVFTASVKTIAKEIFLCNQTSGGSTSVDIAVVPQGDTLAAKHYILKSIPLVANETKQLQIATVIPASATIQMVVASGGSVSTSISGLTNQ